MEGELSNYIVVDIETTGLSKEYDRITEIAAIKIEENKISEKFESLINPKCRISEFITNLTGITNQMVATAPTIEEVLPSFLDFSKNQIMIAHNASFDYGFLNNNCQKHLNCNLDIDRLCTIKLARRIVPKLPSKSLSSLCYHYGINNYAEHRAMGDTIVTNNLFSIFLENLKEKEIKTISQIKNFEKLPIRKSPFLVF
ncbi:MAG: 3'-5' exonuclease [archaeon]